ncbi:patatin [Alcanivorax sp. P2S70]|jgi:NTE family protein|uniref:Patatin-like phospholipase RssA n=1 Tax=Alcanivorax profundi TaxID=2338368 RepID=A0A418XWZ3_9GAMM|nr:MULTISPECIES: patatin-like phospholipase RssA [Alcanivorax]ERP90482.1 patatin [Alcanivorax sp. P2S70]RJG17348.1 patatin-like phospholipase RssA [Alcanivorax profundi]
MTTQLAQEQGTKPVVGLALGSGSARGWAHIGIIQALEEIGVEPQVVAGTSIGALVGGAYVTGSLDAFADWVETLTVKDVFGLLDISFSGGMVKGEKLFGFFREHHANPDIETLDKKLVTVATDMQSGREVWITEGKMLDAARASCALPGLFSPVKRQGRWMLDGGLVNPVPVSAARAMGADVVIAVNLNAQLVGAHMARDSRAQADQAGGSDEERSIWNKMMDYFSSSDGEDPGFFDVVASSINIMQDRITRSRMAGDPPEVTLVPMLEDFALMDFHRAKEAIEEGRALVKRYEADILAWVGSPLADRV